MGQNEGLFENLDFVLLNDEILWSVNASWDNPPHQTILKSQLPREKLTVFLSRPHSAIWGLKDPRMLLTFELWKPLLPDNSDVTYVFVHRPLGASILSLAYRDGLSIERSAQILSPYSENFYRYRYLLQSEKADIVDIYYESLLEDPKPFVREINARMGHQPYHNLELVCHWLMKTLKRF